MLLCPTASRGPARGAGSSFTPWRFWVGGPHPLAVGSYGYNGWLSKQSDTPVARHAGNPVLFDCAFVAAHPRHNNEPLEVQGYWERVMANMDQVCINRHSASINMLFRDWSVRKVGLKELWTLKWHAEFDGNGPWTLAGGVQPGDWPEWMRGFKDY